MSDNVFSHEVVLVLGMHRSGTSALTHVLELLGVDLSEKLLPATAHNPTGHFEDQDVLLLNDAVLEQFNLQWHSPVACQKINFSNLSASSLSARAQQLIGTNSASKRWGLKDPRMCRLLPFWLNNFSQAGMSVSAVLTVRHPVDVASSLQRRDGMSLNHALLLWIEHTLSAERDSRELPRCFVSFEGLIADKQHTSERLAVFLQLDEASFGKAYPAIDNYVSERFIKNDIKDKSAYGADHRDENLFETALEIYQLIAAGDDSPTFRQRLDELKVKFNRISEPVVKSVSEGLISQQYIHSIRDLYQRTGTQLADAFLRLGENDSKLKSNAELRDRVCMGVIEELVNEAMETANYAERKFIDSKLRREIEHFIKTLTTENNLSVPLRKYLEQLKHILRHDDYNQWIVKHELREVDAEVLAERMMLYWQKQPVMHCFMFVLPGEEKLLADTIDSLAAQLLRSWELTVIAPSSAPDPIFEQADFLHWHCLQQDEDPFVALNEEIKQQPTHWVSFIEPGLQYSPQSLAKIADYINLYPDCSFVYTDDDLIDGLGGRSYPRFKPDFNLDLLRSSPYIGNGWMLAGLLDQLGGIQKLPGAENFDLALRWSDCYGEAAFCHVPDVLTHKSSQVDRPFDAMAGKRALLQHFKRLNLNVTVDEGYVDNSFRIEYQHQQKPKVSIIIPTKDKLEFFQPCVESLLGKTQYPNYEVLVIDNQSSDPDTLSYYEQLTENYPDRVRVLSFDKAFNFSEMNNWAAEQASGDYLLLLNNDTEIIQPEWLDRMMNHGQRDDVGIVGARLLYPESGRIQHAGVVLGISDIADHPFNDHLTASDASYMERSRLDQNFSAVTAAVMLVKKSIYQQLNGMDADNLAVLFNDVDLCLRAGKLGYRVVYTPFSMVIHHGSSSLKHLNTNGFYFDIKAYAEKVERTRKEQRYMLNNWLPVLADDPAYNRNLSLNKYEFEPDVNAPQNWDTHHHLRLRTYGVPVRGGSGDYRIKQPFNALAMSGKALAEVGSGHLSISELFRLDPDTVVVQNAISDRDIDRLQRYREFMPQVQIIFMLDDLLHEVPEKSSQYRKMKAAYRDARSRLRKVLAYCDRLIVSTQPLADMCQDMIEDIEIIPNRLQKSKWLGLKSLRKQASKPRVGWAGAQQHQGDLELIVDVVKETAEEVDWVFFGMCPDEIKPYVREEHDFVDIESYPEKLASLNLDLAVAPLEENDFNKAKSNLRLLEYGILGWPVICSDIVPYQTNNAPVIRVSNDKAEWLAAIRQILADPDALQEAGDTLKRWVEQHYLLEDYLGEWFSALATAEFQGKEKISLAAGSQ